MPTIAVQVISGGCVGVTWVSIIKLTTDTIIVITIITVVIVTVINGLFCFGSCS